MGQARVISSEQAGQFDSILLREEMYSGSYPHALHRHNASQYRAEVYANVHETITGSITASSQNNRIAFPYPLLFKNIE